MKITRINNWEEPTEVYNGAELDEAGLKRIVGKINRRVQTGPTTTLVCSNGVFQVTSNIDPKEVIKSFEKAKKK